jgi:hypothetical protein
MTGGIKSTIALGCPTDPPEPKFVKVQGAQESILRLLKRFRNTDFRLQYIGWQVQPYTIANSHSSQGLCELGL